MDRAKIEAKIEELILAASGRGDDTASLKFTQAAVNAANALVAVTELAARHPLVVPQK